MLGMPRWARPSAACRVSELERPQCNCALGPFLCAALPPDERRDRASLSVKWERQRLLSISAMVAFNDDHSIMASMRAAIPAAMNAAVMFAICKLRSCGAKIAVPIYVLVPDANSQLFRICEGRRHDCECGKNIS